MVTAGKMTYEEMETRLQEAEGILATLRSHEEDAAVGDAGAAMVRLKEVEKALQAAREELEQHVAERTAELARVNEELHDTIEEQGRICRRIVGILECITDRKRAQLRLEESNILVVVNDDGRGFNPAELRSGAESGGFGLFSIRQRLTHVGEN